MLGDLGRIFDDGGLSPRGACLLWRPELVWPNALSDAVIGLCLVSILVALAILTARRRDIGVRGTPAGLAAFLLAAAITQFLAVWGLWEPGQGLETAARAVTAAAAVLAAALLWRRLPLAVALPSPTDWRQLRRDLAARTRERDAAVAASAAERAAKSAFLARMSHEIRTSLSSILGYTDLLLDAGIRTPEEQRRLDLIHASGSSLLAVLDGLLDIATIEAGPLVLNPVAFSPRRLAETCAATVRPAAEDLGTAVSVAVDPGVPSRLRGDEARIGRVLLNLLTNAIRAAGTGTVTVHLRAEEEAGRTWLRVAVRDSGPGIPRAQQDRLREALARADAVRPVGGSGLGLALCRRLVALMDGEIGFESFEGHGSTFWVRLPLERVPDEPPGPVRPGVEDISAAPRILLVEDMPANQELVRLILEEEGFVVDTAADGAEAVAKIRTAPYRLVLMDAQMPTMDGLTATRRIRSLEGAAGRVPIVAMTANVMPDQLDTYREAGMDDVIAKPFRRAQLMGVIAHWTLIEADGG
ncbi:hybrid sensor histidine kinase/response regulator [Methylobacterium isbiliense]|uniref:histidine kinase n=1 Tax=Methylobacterium isbiliense TaxID=315478 RepID=A0ABQ4SN98_9HYPH|nr:ATP-binding protein [Methylobacterium isbiliense]MDN3627842.1 response regulator [Methylobacterium isbiliense]GJE03368.1 Sensor histidine kinase RcsC [Methylobacterium isbiliense]